METATATQYTLTLTLTDHEWFITAFALLSASHDKMLTDEGRKTAHRLYRTILTVTPDHRLEESLLEM